MDKEAIIRLVFGVRGCGKTVKVRNLIRDARRLIIFDTCGTDYYDGVCFHSLLELRKFWETVYSGDFRLIYKPSGDDNEIREDVGKICAICQDIKNLTLVIEELNIIFDEKRPPTEFNQMLLSGRKDGIEFVGVAQRPFGFGRKFTSQAKEFYVFYSREPGDVRFFKQSLGTDAALSICTLEQFQYVKWVYAEGVEKYEICKDEFL